MTADNLDFAFRIHLVVRSRLSFRGVAHIRIIDMPLSCATQYLPIPSIVDFAGYGANASTFPGTSANRGTMPSSGPSPWTRMCP
jgi:hypothetical protein